MCQKITQTIVNRMDLDRGPEREIEDERSIFVGSDVETNGLESRAVWSVHVEKS
jgi:hypothetical protein